MLRTRKICTLVLCSLALVFEAKAIFEPPPSGIPNESLKENFERTPIVFIPGILGSRLIKRDLKGKERISFGSLKSLLGEPYAELLLKDEFFRDQELNEPLVSTEEGFDPELYDYLLKQVSQGGALSQKDRGDPISQTQILDRIGLSPFETPESPKLTRLLRHGEIARNVPGVGSTQGIEKALIRSQIPVLQDAGKVNRFLRQVPLLDLLLDGGALGITDAVLRPGLPVYESLLREFEDMGFTEDGNQKGLLYVFSYDWRQNNFYTALQLRKLINKDPHLRGKRIHLVAHSMGNLIGSIYVNALGGHYRIKNWTMIAPPVRGSVNSLLYLFSGPPYLNPFYGADSVRELMFWSPSVWQLLPRDRISLLDHQGKPLIRFTSKGAAHLKLAGLVKAFGERMGDDDRRLENRLRYIKIVMHLNQLLSKVVEEDRDTLCELYALRTHRDLKRIKQKNGECDRLIETLHRIPRLKIITKSSSQPSTLGQMVLNLEKSEVSKLVYNNQGDGVVPFFGTLSLKEFTKYQKWNSEKTREELYEETKQKLIYADTAQHGVLEAIVENSVDLFTLPLSLLFGGKPGPVDKIMTFVPKGVILDSRTTLKVVPGGDHETLPSHLDSIQAIRLNLRNQILKDSKEMKGEAFQSIKVTHPSFGGAEVFWRVYSKKSKKDLLPLCSLLVGDGLRRNLHRWIGRSINIDRKEDAKKIPKHLSRLEVFNRFYVYSIYCDQKSSQKKPYLSMWLHDYRSLNPFKGDLFQQGNMMRVHEATLKRWDQVPFDEFFHRAFQKLMEENTFHPYSPLVQIHPYKEEIQKMPKMAYP